MPPDHCPEHSGNCVKIDSLEGRVRELEAKVGSPMITAAFISMVGVCFSAVTSAVAIVSAPFIRAYLGIN